MSDTAPCGTDRSLSCRCDMCKRYRGRRAKLYMSRKVKGIIVPTDHFPTSEAVRIVVWMRGLGMNWSQMARVTGLDRNQLRIIHGDNLTHVTKATLDKLVAAERALTATHKPAEVATELVDAAVYVWMLDCLAAKGWPVAWVKEQLGWDYHPANRRQNKYLPAQDAADIEALWRAHHLWWGPSRRTAVAAWRAGKFPSDCYLWDQPVPDTRPIPGSLHPDLVREAATFSPQYPHRPAEVLAAMAGWWQWPDGKCADAAMVRWVQSQDGRKGWAECGYPTHDHGLPEMWRVKRGTVA